MSGSTALHGRANGTPIAILPHTHPHTHPYPHPPSYSRRAPLLGKLTGSRHELGLEIYQERLFALWLGGAAAVSVVRLVLGVRVRNLREARERDGRLLEL